MEFLKELFGGQALTYEQLQSAVQSRGFDVVNAADGAYVSKTDADNLQGQIKTLNTQLGEANKKLEGYDPTWREKAETAQNQLKAQRFDFALEKALSKSGARSAAAVRGLLDAKKLQLADDGEILGLDKQIAALKKDEATAFLFADEEKKTTGMRHEGGSEGGMSTKEQANEAIRSLLK